MAEKKIKAPTVTIIFEKGMIDVRWSFYTVTHKEDDGGYSCYIPGFDIYFSAKDIDAMNKKSRVLTKLYFNHFLRDPKNGLKHFALELHKSGFKTVGGDFEMKQLLGNKHVNSKFKSMVNLPERFASSSIIEQESNMSLVA
jgi:hypothetical protein